jgi:hypothetical protein
MLPPEQRKIFKKFLNRLDENFISHKSEIVYWVNSYFSDEDMNGRDIRNLLYAAVAIARADDGILKQRHIEIVKMAKQASQEFFQEQRVAARANKDYQ